MAFRTLKSGEDKLDADAVERNLIPSELQAQVDEIIAANEAGFTDKLMRQQKTSHQDARVL